MTPLEFIIIGTYVLVHLIQVLFEGSVFSDSITAMHFSTHILPSLEIYPEQSANPIQPFSLEST